MSACVSPPHGSVSHIVAVAAIIAQAASTALPPCWKIIAPAVAASGLPVIAIQYRPCRGGFCVRCALSLHGKLSSNIADSNRLKHHFVLCKRILFSLCRVKFMRRLAHIIIKDLSVKVASRWIFGQEAFFRQSSALRCFRRTSGVASSHSPVVRCVRSGE